MLVDAPAARVHHRAQALQRRQRLGELVGVVPAPPALKRLGLVYGPLHAGLPRVRVQVAHRALRDEHLDLAVERALEVLLEVHCEAARVHEDVGVDCWETGVVSTGLVACLPSRPTRVKE